jgi:hypothetical protein
MKAAKWLLEDTFRQVNGFPEIKDGHKDETDFLHTVASISSTNKKKD